MFLLRSIRFFVAVISILSCVAYGAPLPIANDSARVILAYDLQIAAQGKKILSMLFQAQVAFSEWRRKPTSSYQLQATALASRIENEQIRLMSMLLECNDVANTKFAKLGLPEKKGIVAKQVVEVVMNSEICAGGDRCVCGIDYNDRIADDPFGEAIQDTLVTWGAGFALKATAGTLNALRVYWAARNEVAASFLLNKKTGIALLGEERGSISLAEKGQQAIVGKHSGVLGESGILGSFDLEFPKHSLPGTSVIGRFEESIVTFGIKGEQVVPEVVPMFTDAAEPVLITLSSAQSKQVANAELLLNARQSMIARKYGGSAELAAKDGQGFRSHQAAKSALGDKIDPSGSIGEWHHIVEKSVLKAAQTENNLSPWVKSHLIHNEVNYIKLPKPVHARITGYYNCKRFDFTKGLSVREWLKKDCGSKYDCYYKFGIARVEEALKGILERCL